MFQALIYEDEEISLQAAWGAFKEAIQNTVKRALQDLNKEGKAIKVTKQELYRKSVNKPKTAGKVVVVKALCETVNHKDWTRKSFEKEEIQHN